MRKPVPLVLTVISATLLAIAVGAPTQIVLAASQGDGLITYSNMKVEADGKDGWLLGRSVRIKITGTVTNNTDTAIDASDLPKLECTTNLDDSIEATLDEDELVPQANCKVRYEGSVYFDNCDVPQMAFSGPSEYTGLRDAQEKLDGSLASIKADFQEADEKAAQEKAEQEAKKAAEEKVKSDARDKMLACEGKTASEALKAANDLSYSVTFKDAYDVNVTSDVKDSEAGSAISSAVVTHVETSDGWFLSGPSATFTLDYTDPAAKKERDDKEAEDKRKQAAVSALESCMGVTSLESLKLADAAGYKVSYYDSYEVNVTEDVRSAKSDSDIAKATVTDVKLDNGWLFVGPSANITLDYTDPEAAKKREEEERRKKEEEQRKQEEEQKKENYAIIRDCKGKSAGKSQEKVDAIGYRLRINDSEGLRITDDVRSAEKGSPIRRARVTEVEIRNQKEPPCAIFTIDYLSPKSLENIKRQDKYPSEITLSATNVLVEDSDPTARSATFYITITGQITNNASWEVSTKNLPKLRSDSYNDKYGTSIMLDGEASILGPGETRGFRYRTSTSYASITYTLKAENDDVLIHGAQEICDEIGRQLPIVKETHDANADYLREQRRINRTCYYTDTGHCYHLNGDCFTLSRSNNIYSTTVGEAESWGLEPCGNCG